MSINHRGLTPPKELLGEVKGWGFESDGGAGAIESYGAIKFPSQAGL